MEEVLKASCILLTNLKQNAFRPGYIENWTVVIDANYMGVASFPYSVLKRSLKVFLLNYAGCLHRVFILNASITFLTVINFSSKILPEETMKKIVIVKPKEKEQLLSEISHSQLLSSYGGSLPLYSGSLWPIPNTLKESAEPENPSADDLMEPMDQVLSQKNMSSKSIRSPLKSDGSVKNKSSQKDKEGSSKTLPKTSNPQSGNLSKHSVISNNKMGEEEEEAKQNESEVCPSPSKVDEEMSQSISSKKLQLKKTKTIKAGVVSDDEEEEDDEDEEEEDEDQKENEEEEEDKSNSKKQLSKEEISGKNSSLNEKPGNMSNRLQIKGIEDPSGLKVTAQAVDSMEPKSNSDEKKKKVTFNTEMIKVNKIIAVDPSQEPNCKCVIF